MIYSVLISFFCIFLLIKIYRMFTVIRDLEEFFFELEEQSRRALNKIQSIDKSGHFEADDEVGWTFDYIKKVINQINNKFTREDVE